MGDNLLAELIDELSPEELEVVSASLQALHEQEEQDEEEERGLAPMSVAGREVKFTSSPNLSLFKISVIPPLEPAFLNSLSAQALERGTARDNSPCPICHEPFEEGEEV